MSECDAKHDDLLDVVDERIDLCKADLVMELRKLNQTLAHAFPKGDDGLPDIAGHRQYHEDLMRAAKAQERFWEEMRLDIAKKGAWGLLIILIGLLIVGIETKLGLFRVLP